jgi:hypothetical protein
MSGEGYREGYEKQSRNERIQANAAKIEENLIQFFELNSEEE